jgi:hypothetical protein
MLSGDLRRWGAGAYFAAVDALSFIINLTRKSQVAVVVQSSPNGSQTGDESVVRFGRALNPLVVSVAICTGACSAATSIKLAGITNVIAEVNPAA